MSASIFEHISAHLPESGPGLTEGGEFLPDEPSIEEEPVRLAPGLHDHIVDPGSVLSAEQTAASVLKVFVEAASRSADSSSRSSGESRNRDSSEEMCERSRSGSWRDRWTACP
jgi:hypothetical protein